MSELSISITLKLPSGAPALGLTLADIDLWLTAQHRVTGVPTVIWDGTQNPTVEETNVGVYVRIYDAADFDLYNYYAVAEYTGATVLERDWVLGGVGITYLPLGFAKELDYFTFEDDGVTPIANVRVEVHTDAAMTNGIWVGYTESSGELLDNFSNKPRFNPDTYYLHRRKSGWQFENPDIEVIS